MSTSENPFASPRATSEVIVAENASIAEAESIRRKYLNHETSLKSIGLLYYLGIVLAVAVTVPLVIDALQAADMTSSYRFGFLAGLVAVIMVLIGIQFFIGRGLRTLDKRVRIPATLFSLLGLFGFPVGTLVNLLVLYLLWSPKGSVVFSPEYKQVMLDTPHIKYKTSIIVWIAVGLLLLVIGIGVVGAIVSLVFHRDQRSQRRAEVEQPIRVIAKRDVR